MIELEVSKFVEGKHGSAAHLDNRVAFWLLCYGCWLDIENVSSKQSSEHHRTEAEDIA
jgi:hypothetical protein